MYEDIFEEPTATRKEQDREAARKSGGRLAYDCYHTRVCSDDRVLCDKGHTLNPQSKDNTASLPQIIRGVRFRVCQMCEDWDCGDGAYG